MLEKKSYYPIFVFILLMSTFAFAQHPPSPDNSSTFERLKAGSPLVMGVRENALPFSNINEQGAFGYSVDICNRVIHNLEKKFSKPIKVKYVGVNAQNRIELLKNGTIDMECGTTTHTYNREKEVSFSYPFFISGIRMAIRKGSKFDDYQKLHGATVAVTKGATAEKIVEGLQKTMDIAGKPFQIRYVNSNDEGIDSVKNAQSDAFMTDDILLAGVIATHGYGDEVTRVGRNLSVEPYAIMIRKNDGIFLSEIDKAMYPILTGGEAEKLFTTWFSTPALRYNLSNLNKAIFADPAKSPAFP